MRSIRVDSQLKRNIDLWLERCFEIAWASALHAFVSNDARQIANVFMSSSPRCKVHVSVAARSDIGQVRENNEDAFLVADLTRGERTLEASLGRIEVGDKGVLLVVSDGMGGHKAGEVASALVVQGFARALESGAVGAPPIAYCPLAAFSGCKPRLAGKS